MSSYLAYELQLHVGVLFYRLCASSEVPVAEILFELARVIDDSSVTRLNVNRGNVWQSTKRAFTRTSFSASNRLDIKFIDDIGTSEGAVDQGGPRREFLQLLMDFVFRGSHLFCGHDEARHITMFQDGMLTKTFFD